MRVRVDAKPAADDNNMITPAANSRTSVTARARHRRHAGSLKSARNAVGQCRGRGREGPTSLSLLSLSRASSRLGVGLVFRGVLS